MGNTQSIPPKAGIDHDEANWLEAIEKSYVFVWCDATIGSDENVADANNTLKSIASIANANRQLIHTFNELDACRDFIAHVHNVCLITSGSLGETFVPMIHNLEQIHSIYIFCCNKAKHQLWADHYRKVRGVFTDIKMICGLLNSYLISQPSADYDRIEFDVISSDQNISSSKLNELNLIHSKFNKMILLNMDSNEHAKQDMISYYRNKYTSEYQTQLINRLDRDYAQYNPIWWYTLNCFFQGTINRALRTHDLYALCSMHRFIKDLNSELSRLHDTQRTSNEPLNLYFGQLLSKHDFHRLQANRGELLCIDQFVSANPDRNIATLFIKQQKSFPSNKHKVRVLFEIHIDRTLQPNVPYANIGSVSDFVHEEEYLISMFSVYRIEKIEQVGDIASIWLIQLTLVDTNNSQYRNLTQCIQTAQLEDVNLVEVGYTIKDRLHQFQSTNKLFQQALHGSNEECRTMIAHYNMAIIYDVLGAYEKSMDEYRCVLHLAKTWIPTCQQDDDLCLVALYSNWALTYQQEYKFPYAISYAFRALGIVSRKPPLNSKLRQELESSCCFVLGSIHDREGKVSDAQCFYEQALRIRREYLPLGHPDITLLQRLITLVSTEEVQSVHL